MRDAAAAAGTGAVDDLRGGRGYSRGGHFPVHQSKPVLLLLLLLLRLMLLALQQLLLLIFLLLLLLLLLFDDT